MRAAPLMLRSVACLAAAGIAGCVTEVVPVKTARESPANGPLNTTPPVGASPVPGGATNTTRVAAAIKPVGAVPYDGLTLPLVTPDGRWIVTQTGSIPPWQAVLAEPGAAPVTANAIAAYEFVGTSLRPAQWPAEQGGETSSAPRVPATAGLLLGRSAGEGWVLVERPNPNGSRWIGKLRLETGDVEWLVQGEAVNAQALLLRDGTLVYSRRSIDQAPSELVFQPKAEQPAGGQPAAPAAAERTVRREGWRFCQPVATPDQAIVAVLAISAQESELLAYSTTKVDVAGAPLLVGRQTLGAMSAAAAFQSVTSIEACPPDIESALRATILVMNADRRRLSLWDPIRGTTSMLPASFMAAVRVNSPVATGLVMSSPRGSDFWSGIGLPARLVAGSYIPRSYGGPNGSRLFLLSPQTDTAVPTLRVVSVEIVAPNP